MTGFAIKTFSGKAPKVYARLLPSDVGQEAINVRLDSGRLEPWKDNASTSITPVASYTVTSQTKTLFKYDATTWMGSNRDLDIVRSPIAEDPWERIYVTGKGAGSTAYPQMTLSTLVNSDTYFRLGLPAPDSLPSPPVLTNKDSSATIPSGSPTTSLLSDQETPKSISYVVTYVTAYGEEGPPSQPLISNIVDIYSDQNATVTFPTNPTGYGNIAKKRLYRTDTSGTYRRVKDSDYSAATVLDNLTESQLQEALPSASWEAPPDEVTSGDYGHKDGPMLGLVAMPNGILAGFSGQTICFSEAFLPHAWPRDYQLTAKSDIVALAPMTNGLLVLTKEKPAMIQGLDPSSMSMTEIDSTLSCVSKRSVVDMGEYAMYASPDGLVMGGERGLQVATQDILTREQWQELVPSSIVGFAWEGHYIGFYSTGSENKGFIFDPKGGKNSFVSLDFHATAGFNDLENDELYLVVGGNVVKFASGSNKNFTWRSKKFYTPRPINPAVAKVDCDTYGSGITFKLFVDGSASEAHSQIITSSTPFRLPSGYKGKEFEVQVQGSVPINEVCVYESVEEFGSDQV